MSLGVGILVAALLAVGALLALQAFAHVRTREQVGTQAPALDGLPRHGVALVWFHSPTCGPCRAMKPAITAVAGAGATVVHIDVSQRPDVAQAFAVMATPTTVLVREGVVRDTRVGAQRREQLEALLAGG